MKASIIVPTLNRSALLRKLVFSITQQTFPVDQFELIIVDNASTDSTRETVNALIEIHPHHQIRYVSESEAGNLAARHRGAFEAKGDLFIFVDDDIETVPGWLGAIVDGFSDPKVSLIGGRNLPRYEIEPPAWIKSFWATTPEGGRTCWYLSLLDLGEQKRQIDPNYIWSLNLAIRRQTFHQLGGFHPDSFSEKLQHFQGDGESGLMMPAAALKFLAIYEPAAVAYHFVPASRMTPEYFEKRGYSQGIRDSYSAVRRNGGLSIGRLTEAFHLIGKVVRQLKRFGHGEIIGRPEKRMIREIRRRVANAHQAGFAYHQRVVRLDPKILEWVLRPHYWDYRLPG